MQSFEYFLSFSFISYIGNYRNLSIIIEICCSLGIPYWGVLLYLSRKNGPLFDVYFDQPEFK